MRIVLATVLCLAAFAASAQIYRWTDDKGRLHVTDTPPPTTAKNVRKSGEPPAHEPTPAEPFALQRARTKFPITLYTAPDCEGCNEARKLLNARGLPFKEISVTTEVQHAELKKVVGSATVPAMIVGSTVQRGFEPGVYQGLLDSAGYPKTGDLAPRSQEEPKAPEPATAEAKPVAEPEVERPLGPYAPGAATQKATKKNP